MLGMFRNQIEYGKIFFARASIQNLDCSQYFFLTKFFLSFKIIHFRLFSFKYTYIVIHIKKSTCIKLLCPLTAGGWRPSEFNFFYAFPKVCTYDWWPYTVPFHSSFDSFILSLSFKVFKYPNVPSLSLDTCWEYFNTYIFLL